MTATPTGLAKGAKRRLTVIFKGTNRCNGACTFCSVGPSGDRTVTAEDFGLVVEQLGSLVNEWGIDDLNFTFHGGEPTILGPAMMDSMCEQLRGLSATVELTLQSNLLRVTPATMEVWRKQKIHVGSSIDPISSGRRFANGTDAFPQWLHNLQRLTDEGFNIGSIFVVTKEALPHAQALYRICEAIGAVVGQRFGLQLNPVYAQGSAAEEEEGLITPEEFGRFLVEIWQIWEASGRSVRLAPIDAFVRAFENQNDDRPQLPCSFAGDCSRSHIGIDYDLNVAGCGRRLDSRAFLGNLREQPLTRLLEETAEKHRIAHRASDLRSGHCDDCRFIRLCNGGCPDDASLATGSIEAPTPWCRSYLTIFEAMEAAVAGRIRTGRQPDVQTPSVPQARLIHLRSGPAELAATRSNGVLTERWLLPTPDGQALRFDSNLDASLDRDTALLRIWAHNRHAKAFMMWRELVRNPRVRIVLFEAEGLAVALNVLNALHATVVLDAPGILAEEGGAALLEDALERYLRDPLWSAQIFPFSWMLFNGVHRQMATPMNRWGLAPGTYQVDAGEDGTGEVTTEALVAGLTDVAEKDRAGWMLRNRGCMECNDFRICGGYFAPGNGLVCDDRAHALVTKLCAVAAEVQESLAGGDARS